MLQPGQIVGGAYRLERIIGQGAFATVWEATDLLTHRQVAVKALADAPSRKPTSVARFLKEARFCATPIHPTIITVQDLGQTDEGIPYLVMDLLVGHTLDQVLRAKGSLPWTMVVEIMTHVLAGLAAAHERDIIHRDIKPSNIFLVEGACAGPPVKLLDLGLARDLSDDKRLTRTGQVVGTANYLPPETLLDEQPKGGTKAGDVFAAGMVLFVGLTGRFPFLTSTEVHTAAAEVFARATFYKSRAPLPGPREVEPSVPEPLDLVVRRALAVDPAQRYTDASEMSDALVAAIRVMLPEASEHTLSKALEKTCLGLPSYLADADLVGSEDAFASIPPGSLPPPLVAASPQPEVRSVPPALAKTSAARPIMTVGRSSSPAPPRVEAARESRPSASPRLSEPARMSTHPRTSRPSWIRRSRIGLSLVGIALGTVVGVAILGGLAAWRHSARRQAVIASQPVAEEQVSVARPPHVEMAIRGLPEGARVSLDDQVVTGAVIQGVPGRSAVLEVEAPTIEPLRLEFTFEAGRSVDLTDLVRPRSPATSDGDM